PSVSRAGNPYTKPRSPCLILREPMRDIHCRNVWSYNGISAPSSRAADGAMSQRFPGLVLERRKSDKPILRGQSCKGGQCGPGQEGATQLISRRIQDALASAKPVEPPEMRE